MATRIWICALIVATSLAPTTVAEAQTTIRVALTDMSSSMGMSMMGQGMMVPGAGSMMGPGMMGQGMMGQGSGTGMMMGMMAIRTDQDHAKSGSIKFDVTNWSRSLKHEMLIVATDNPNAPLPYDFASARVLEEQVKVLGDTSELSPSQSKVLDVKLEPGSYLLICNVNGHYAAGMAIPFTVTQ